MYLASVASGTALAMAVAAFIAGGWMVAVLAVGRRLRTLSEGTDAPRPASPRPGAKAQPGPSAKQQSDDPLTPRILESVQDGVIAVDAQGNVTFVNRAASGLLDWTARDLMGVRLHHLAMHSDDAGRSISAADGLVAQVLADGKRVSQPDVVFWRRDKTSIHLPVTATPLHERGQVSGAVLVLRDVRALQEARQEASDLEALLQEAEAMAGFGSWEWRIPEDEVTWSDQLYKIYGVPKQDGPLAYELYMARVHEADRELAGSVVQHAMETGEPYAFQHRLKRPDGEVRVLVGRGRADLEGGRPVRLFGTATDITETPTGAAILNGTLKPSSWVPEQESP